MSNDTYRWQDLVIARRRGWFDLGSALLIALLMGFAFVAGSGGTRPARADGAVRLPVAADTAPSLDDAAKPRVMPKRAADWLPRREIGEP